MDLTPELNARVEALLAELTLDEKIALVHANSKFSVAGVERLGIPEWVMSDGPHGVRQELERDSWAPAFRDDDFVTYLPTGAALAATWSRACARLHGEVLGAEARGRGKDVILGPGINIVRTPLCGRNFEYYGEDPHHVGALAAEAIRGIQSHDVAACVKHYALNSQELNRHGVDACPDDRTLHELYLPAFRAAVCEGGALTVMGAYNCFRGQHCCHNELLLNTILKGEWDFRGSVISDWAGAYDTGEAARYGLDVEMGTNAPYDDYFLARPFRDAIAAGTLDAALLDDKVRRNLRVMAATKLLGGDRKPGAVNTEAHQQAARRIAREAIVLLKNDGDVLPLGGIGRLLVVGENAAMQHHAGGNSSAVKALYEVTPLEGLRAALGDSVTIEHLPGYPPADDAGEPIPQARLGVADHGAGTNGWTLSLYAAPHPVETVVERSVVDSVDAAAAETPPHPDLPAGGWSARWETTFTPAETGEHTFVLTGATQAQLLLDGEQLIQRWETDGPDRVSKSIRLAAGTPVRLVVEHLPGGAAPTAVRLGWFAPGAVRTAGEEERARLLDAARRADAVVVFGGLNHQYDVEGCDRPDMALHDGQNELIDALAGANPRLAVVLVGGAPMELPWIDRVPAVVQLWYAGMEGGHAIAEVLLGRVNPSGRLPFTFPKRLADSPAHALDDYAADRCDYREGLLVGYRWFDAKGIEPLFPFGHGLTYTRFAYDDLVLEPGDDGTVCTVRCTVTNTGDRAGQAVPQLYVRDEEAGLPRPDKELKGFDKVVLEPGASATVRLPLTVRDLSFYDPDAGAWRAEPGAFTILVGASAADIRLEGRLDYAG